MHQIKISLLLFILIFTSCTQKLEEVSYQSNSCGKNPGFINSIGFDLSRSGFYTADNKQKGLFFVQFYPGTTTVEKKYQDSTWKQAGWMSALLIDKSSNVWCVPAPQVNVLDNPVEKQNNLYRVVPQTGKMELFMELPNTANSKSENPYGLMGLAYNCEADLLYVSSVAGSTRSAQKGKIYCIDVANKKIIDTYNSGDAFGICVSYKDGFRKLYYGSARNSNIYAIGLNDKGKFVGEAKQVFTIAGLGARGDDKVKKIREDKNGNLLLSAFEFNFNLTAPHEKQEANYIIKYNMGDEKWEQLQ
jgi:hypothetical protein